MTPVKFLLVGTGGSAVTYAELLARGHCPGRPCLWIVMPPYLLGETPWAGEQESGGLLFAWLGHAWSQASYDDVPVEKALLLESGFDELHGVDWDKGCYMGQELTARTKYRGLVKRRLFPVKVDGPLPAPGTAIQRDGQEVGEIRSGSGDRARAMLRLDARDGTLTAQGARIVPEVPGWMRLP